jgi:UDP-2-acetamido-2,6-beta-L-arabino-hexul-4-ose reductase
MLKIGITGQAGFIGKHLFNTLRLNPDIYERITFYDNYFSNEFLLRSFVRQCDVIVHLAAMSRHPDPQIVYETNIKLVKKLIQAMESESVSPFVMFSSSIQENCDNEYGKSKREGYELLEKWAHNNGASLYGMILPNVYGPFCKPNYASFIATFCYKLTHGEVPEVLIDNQVKLIYIGNLINYILSKIEEVTKLNKPLVECNPVSFDFEKKVTEILNLFEKFKEEYFDNGFIPKQQDINETNLFNTFCSYIDHKKYYPVKLDQKVNKSGEHAKTVKFSIGGLVSISKTMSGVTNGNHYHIRTFERLTVIKGKARIQLRQIGTEEIIYFFLDGIEPSYVDIPIWHTYNITNIGYEDLYTQSWTNVWDQSKDADIYIESV